MNKISKVLGICVLTASSLGYASVEDDPILTKVMGEIETSNTDEGRSVSWNVDAWVGKDLEKVWIKSEGERIGGETEEAELQVLYSEAIDPYWDLQYGLKKDFNNDQPDREWAVLAAKGVAPYFFEVDASLFVGEGGRTAARLDAEYEYMLSQKLVLSPEIEINAFSKDDEATGTGKGLSTIDAGLRLRYEVTREFAPYVGVEWGKKYGNTANFALAEGSEVEDAEVVAGIKFWF